LQPGHLQGWLKKQGEQGWGWKKRWFVLKDNKLNYYAYVPVVYPTTFVHCFAAYVPRAATLGGKPTSPTCLCAQGRV
jgi:hypothetical protein